MASNLRVTESVLSEEAASGNKAPSENILHLLPAQNLRVLFFSNEPAASVIIPRITSEMINFLAKNPATRVYPFVNLSNPR
jgi:hypothetical protein